MITIPRPFRFTSPLAGPLVASLLVASLPFVACAGDATTAEESTPVAVEPASDAAPAPVRSGSADAAPVSNSTALSGDSRIEAPGVVFDLPAAWQREQPASSMRLAQAAIPGDAGPGQLTVFYFGPGGGGGVDANLERWASQVEASAAAARETFDQGPLRITWIDIEGTLKPSTMGMGPTEPQPGSRLLGAVVEGPQGPWFFKATGPSATLDAQRDAFLDMLRSVEVAGS